MFFLFLIFMVQINGSSCSRKVLPGISYTKLENKTGKGMLNRFLEDGTGKRLPMGTVSEEDLISTAKEYIGVPHRMGGCSSRGMDCSGLLMRVFAIHGITLPHNSEEQARYGDIIESKSQLKKGDLVFFVNTYRTQRFITHSGIYAGNNRFVHTSSSQGVTITSLDNVWWRDKFIFGTRIFN
ncbi:NlpC/P60 family protein [Marinilabilia rubra]|uniref:NlpC/P60 family protein n=2 Tax=Marinilabilia rubra TaxID=2162893 RepID=A0A2U2BBA9_9BACT|nr:NlpC/P60 family protein [Marinilabilia rubra]